MPTYREEGEGEKEEKKDDDDEGAERNKRSTKKRTVVVVSAMLQQAKQSFKIISTKFDCKYPFKIRAPV